MALNKAQHVNKMGVNEEIDIYQLPPRKEVHTKPKAKILKEKPKKERQIKNVEVKGIEGKDIELEKEDTRIDRREKKKEKKVRRWNVYLLRFIVILFIITLITIPFYYRGGLFEDRNQDKDINSNPFGEEIQFSNQIE